MRDERRLGLDRVAASVSDVPIERKLLIGRAARVLIEEVVRSKIDLLRKWPCAVLVVKPDRLESSVPLDAS